jgi:hypothetical protein
MVTIFKFEEFKCNEEIFKKFMQLGKRRQGDIKKYFRDMVSFDYQVGDPISQDLQKKYVFHSMILNLDDIKTLYDFFKDFMEVFTTSKLAIQNICKT